MSSFYVILQLAVATLLENKLRSALTLLGMIFGNAAVIATLSSNDGAKVFIANQLASLGNKLMTVQIKDRFISDHDRDVTERFVDEIEFAVREIIVGQGSARRGRRTTPISLAAVDQSYFKAMNLDLASGRQALESEYTVGQPVAYMGHRTRQALFGDESFVNEYVSVKFGNQTQVLKIIGAFREKGSSAVALDSSIFISPALGRKLATTKSGRLLVMLKDDNRSTVAKYQILNLLTPKFGGLMTVSDARESIERTKAIWSKQNLVGICLAAISLVTGGVGIMNIMLLSIQQRQKEIGLRKAVGAQNSEIAFQFLLETVIICIFGGMLGVVLGWAFGNQVAAMLGDWEASLSLLSVGVALGFSVLTGIAFGALPAMRAARIDPYDALRTG